MGSKQQVTGQEKDPNGDFSELAAALPRGRHGLPADEVERRQRERVASAVVRVLAEIGYGSMTVALLLEEAGISRSTFYEFFANKREAVVASYDLYFERFCEVLAARCADDRDRAERVRTAIGVAMDVASREPEKAQLLAGTSLIADPGLAEHVYRTHDRLALMLCQVEGAAAEPDLVLVALLETVTQVLARRLAGAGRGDLAELETRLVRLILGGGGVA